MVMFIPLLILSLLLGRCFCFQGMPWSSLGRRAVVLLFPTPSPSPSPSPSLYSSLFSSSAIRLAPTPKSLYERTESDLSKYDALKDSLAKKMFLAQALRTRDYEVAALQRIVEGLEEGKTREEARQAVREEAKALFQQLVTGKHLTGELGAFQRRFFPSHTNKGEPVPLSAKEALQLPLLLPFLELCVVFPQETDGVHSFQEIVRLLQEKRETVEAMDESKSLMVECNHLYAAMNSSGIDLDLIYEAISPLEDSADALPLKEKDE